MNDPQAIYNAYKRYYVAIGSDNIEEILPNVARMQLPRVDDPVMENRGALSPVPMMQAAFPDQHHEMHIQSHLQLLNDPTYGRMLSEMARQELMEHVQAQAAFLYGKVENQNGHIGDGPGWGPKNGGGSGKRRE